MAGRKIPLQLSGCLLLLLTIGENASAQQSETWAELWSEASTFLQLKPGTRLNLTGGTRTANEASYLQWFEGGQVNFQLKHVNKEHLTHYDSDKEKYFVFGVGYQFWHTTEEHKSPSNENRILIEGTPRFYPRRKLLVSDRNLVELRFINGEYSTRYRNRLTLEHAFQVHHLRFDPYVWGELFYDTRYDSWVQNQYSSGIQFQFKRHWMLDGYYLHQNTSHSTPNHLNVAGLTLNIFL